MTNTKSSYTFIGNDCPPGYRKVGTIDVADPADVSSAQDRGYRIGMIYDGYSGSCAEPCAADIYERPDEELPSSEGNLSTIVGADDAVQAAGDAFGGFSAGGT